MPLKAPVLGGIALGIFCGRTLGEVAPEAPSRHVQTSFSSTEEWNFNQTPSPNITSHWIFDNVNSLLQHWPNTRLRNGHTIVPGLIAPGTLLYHATTTHAIPTVPEWVATDPDHSYVYCHSPPVTGGDTGGEDGAMNKDTEDRDKGCWHLTLTPTRPLKVLYFDGSSAAKMWGGPMDSQDLLVWGRVRKERTFDERGRIEGLCKWGRGMGVDGFVRMQGDFEVMFCDFSAGLSVVSFLKLPSVDGGFFPYPTPSAAAFRLLEAGSWHNHFPGENRVRLDYSRLVSFYDTELFPSLQTIRAGHERWDHRLEGISKEDVDTLRVELERVMEGEWGTTKSDVDWQAVFSVVSTRHAERLEILRYLLRSLSTAPQDETLAGLKQVHRQLTATLRPYLLHSVRPPPRAQASDLEWAVPAWVHCSTTHTRAVEMNPQLTRSERLLSRAVRDTSKEICRVLVGMWAEGKIHVLDIEENPVSNLRGTSLKKLVENWKTKIEGLIAWLDWSVWARCEPACSYEEMCYMPQWPFFKHMPPGPTPDNPNKTEGVVRDRSSPDDDWDRPVPRCIRRIEPFGV
ncbi:unnamed protein product [Cyclocybe aegerita]|uniref:Uncharacterized protein n=1 Tax=Cyclocybe aegerita TaxID=1973307 RepID=A0A8S0WF07_CYCAE|nr:unnamed protein product [Cyclocybe aegerita]